MFANASCGGEFPEALDVLDDVCSYPFAGRRLLVDQMPGSQVNQQRCYQKCRYQHQSKADGQFPAIHQPRGDQQYRRYQSSKGRRCDQAQIQRVQGIHVIGQAG